MSPPESRIRFIPSKTIEMIGRLENKGFAKMSTLADSSTIPPEFLPAFLHVESESLKGLKRTQSLTPYPAELFRLTQVRLNDDLDAKYALLYCAAIAAIKQLRAETGDDKIGREQYAKKICGYVLGIEKGVDISYSIYKSPPPINILLKSVSSRIEARILKGKKHFLTIREQMEHCFASQTGIDWLLTCAKYLDQSDPAEP